MEMDDAIIEILKSCQYVVEMALKKSTNIYDGIIMSQGQNGKWNIRYNGEVHEIKPYKVQSPKVGDVVKVFIPQGNQANSFFI